MGLLLILSLYWTAGDDVEPLPNAHAHNDYRHPRPLHSALEHGFCSVEADIYLTEDGQLLVGHDKSELKPDRTLEGLYLRPLRERVRQHGGRVYLKGPPFLLLIDIKSEARPTFAALAPVLQKYADILTEVREGQVHERAVMVVLSGNRPSLDELARQSPRFAGYDGRIKDLSSNVPAHLMPLVSDNWTFHFGWNGSRPFTEKERDKLATIVRQAHAKGRKVRFWATPEKSDVWDMLLEHRVDLINTDRLSELRTTLRR